MRDSSKFSVYGGQGSGGRAPVQSSGQGRALPFRSESVETMRYQSDFDAEMRKALEELEKSREPSLVAKWLEVQLSKIKIKFSQKFSFPSIKKTTKSSSKQVKKLLPQRDLLTPIKETLKLFSHKIEEVIVHVAQKLFLPVKFVFQKISTAVNFVYQVVDRYLVSLEKFLVSKISKGFIVVKTLAKKVFLPPFLRIQRAFMATQKRVQAFVERGRVLLENLQRLVTKPLETMQNVSYAVAKKVQQTTQVFVETLQRPFVKLKRRLDLFVQEVKAYFAEKVQQVLEPLVTASLWVQQKCTSLLVSLAFLKKFFLFPFKATSFLLEQGKKGYQWVKKLLVEPFKRSLSKVFEQCTLLLSSLLQKILLLLNWFFSYLAEKIQTVYVFLYKELKKLLLKIKYFIFSIPLYVKNSSLYIWSVIKSITRWTEDKLTSLNSDVNV